MGNFTIIQLNYIAKLVLFVCIEFLFPRFESCLEEVETFGAICAIYKVTSSALALIEQLIMSLVIMSSTYEILQDSEDIKSSSLVLQILVNLKKLSSYLKLYFMAFTTSTYFIA